MFRVTTSLMRRASFVPRCVNAGVLLNKDQYLCTNSPANEVKRPLPDWLRYEVNRFDDRIPLEEAKTPPASWYVLPEFEQLDSDTVFLNNWIAVEKWHSLKEPGNFVTGTLGNEPYIISRTKDGKLEGFYNVCRHHATLVEERPGGSTDCFTCPYHGWKYDLNGRLLQATKLKGIKDFKAKDFGLKPIRVEEWGPLVFINLTKSAPDIHQQLSHLKSEMDSFGDSRDMIHVERKTYKIKCNWKVYIDNYLDGGYHVPYAHKALSELLSLDSYKTELFDGYSIQSSGGKGDDEKASDRVGSNVLYAHIYPNVTINRYGPWLDLNYAFPLGAEKCLVMFDWFLERKHHASLTTQEVGELVKENLEASERVQQEDIEICERVQKGLRSRGYEWGRYSPRLEIAEHDFHVRLKRDYIKNM